MQSGAQTRLAQSSRVARRRVLTLLCQTPIVTKIAVLSITGAGDALERRRPAGPGSARQNEVAGDPFTHTRGPQEGKGERDADVREPGQM